MDAPLNRPTFLAWPQPACSATLRSLAGSTKLFLSQLGALRGRLARVRRALSRPGADELLGMSEHELKDLGIGRSEIPHVLGHRAGV